LERKNLTLEKALESLTEENLKELIEDQVLEKKRLDYKLLLPGSSDGDKKEFLADVSSFANSSGGDLIYGISQDSNTGLPLELVGVDCANTDMEILRLESIIREGIEPRIPSIAVQPVKLANSKVVLILRIQKSWALPHRIKFKEDHHFWARATNGKYKLDIGELRDAFTLRENLNERINRFREDRIAKIFANETPIPFYDNAKIVLHLVPLSSFDPSTLYDLTKIKSRIALYEPIRTMSWSSRYNLEGLLAYSANDSGLSHAYTQLYRNGIIEAVDGLMLKPDRGKHIPSVAYEEELLRSLAKYLSALKFLKVEMPIIVFLTLVDVKGYSMVTDAFFEDDKYTLDKDVLILPESIVESYDEKPQAILKAEFDAIWNACGYSKSLNYNDEGEWSPRVS
jgi:hypothetical protein